MNYIGKKISNTDYVIEQDINISGKHYVFAADSKAKNPYVTGVMVINDILTDFRDFVLGDNYLEVLQIWNQNVAAAVANACEKLRNVPDLTVLGKNDVIPIDDSISIENKIIVINPEVFLRELRYSQKQLQLCTGGFGSESNSRGRSIFCKSVENGSQVRFSRSDVMGILRDDKVPAWAKDKISDLKRTYGDAVTASVPSLKPVLK